MNCCKTEYWSVIIPYGPAQILSDALRRRIYAYTISTIIPFVFYYRQILYLPGIIRIFLKIYPFFPMVNASWESMHMNTMLLCRIPVRIDAFCAEWMFHMISYKTLHRILRIIRISTDVQGTIRRADGKLRNPVWQTTFARYGYIVFRDNHRLFNWRKGRWVKSTI